MSTSLGIASDGLLDRGTSQSLHIAVRGLICILDGVPVVVDADIIGSLNAANLVGCPLSLDIVGDVDESVVFGSVVYKHLTGSALNQIVFGGVPVEQVVGTLDHADIIGGTDSLSIVGDVVDVEIEE